MKTSVKLDSGMKLEEEIFFLKLNSFRMAEHSGLGSIQAGCSSNRCVLTTRTSSVFCIPVARLPPYSVSSSFCSFPCLQFSRIDWDRMVFGPTSPWSSEISLAIR